MVELLVVIAIISILAAILLPALNHAKMTAEKSFCLNNEKQLFLASAFYSSDFNNWIPPSYNAAPYHYWQHVLVDLKYVNGCWDPKGISRMVDVPMGVYNCPSEERIIAGGATIAWNTFKGCHYGLAIYLSTNLPLSQNYYGRMHMIPVPSQVAFIGDKSAGRKNDFRGSENHLDKYRHSNGMNVHFVDGHGVWLPRKDVPHSEIDSIWYKKVFWGFKYYHEKNYW